MTADDDPYRRPITSSDHQQPDAVPAARTPGVLEILLISAASTFVGGITFFVTCLGTFLPIATLQQFLPAVLRNRPEIRALSALLIPVVLIGSVYVAFRTARAFFRFPKKSRTRSGS